MSSPSHAATAGPAPGSRHEHSVWCRGSRSDRPGRVAGGVRQHGPDGDNGDGRGRARRAGPSRPCGRALRRGIRPDHRLRPGPAAEFAGGDQYDLVDAHVVIAAEFPIHRRSGAPTAPWSADRPLSLREAHRAVIDVSSTTAQRATTPVEVSDAAYEKLAEGDVLVRQGEVWTRAQFDDRACRPDTWPTVSAS